MTLRELWMAIPHFEGFIVKPTEAVKAESSGRFFKAVGDVKILMSSMYARWLIAFGMDLKAVAGKAVLMKE